MNLVILSDYLVAGSVAGVLSGFFGLGGGVIIVPLLILTFELQRIFPAQDIVHMAIGSSMMTIFFVSIGSAIAHFRRETAGFIRFLLWLVPSAAVGGVVGAFLSNYINPKNLTLAFAILVPLLSLSFFLPARQLSSFAKNPKLLSCLGTFAGLYSTLFGIGSGSLIVPVLSYLGVPMTTAVAASSTLSIPVALIGSLIHMFAASSSTNVAWCTGNVYWPAVTCISLTSIPFSRFATKLNRRLPEKKLKKAFLVLMFLISIMLIKHAIS